MNLWQDGLIALLAAIGLSSILWMIARALLFPPIRPVRAAALLAARGDAGELEEQVVALSLLSMERGLPREILLVDCGLTDEGKKRCALLSAQHRRVTVCLPSEIHKHI